MLFKAPLQAVQPKRYVRLSLQELWDLVGVAEKALLAVSALAVVVGLPGMLVALMTSLN